MGKSLLIYHNMQVIYKTYPKAISSTEQFIYITYNLKTLSDTHSSQLAAKCWQALVIELTKEAAVISVIIMVSKGGNRICTLNNKLCTYLYHNYDTAVQLCMTSLYLTNQNAAFTIMFLSPTSCVIINQQHKRSVPCSCVCNK